MLLSRAFAAALGATAGISFTVQAQSPNTEGGGERPGPRGVEQHDWLRDAVDWSGLVEVEAFAGEDFASNDTSDIELATVELGADARVNDYVSAGILLLFEEGTPGDIEVDEATIGIAAPGSAWGLTVGRLYVPFGAFDTALISDTLALEVGETNESAAVVAFDSDQVRLGAYAFNGDTTDAGDDSGIKQFGLSARANGGDRFAWQAGADYINSLGDADGLALARVDDFVGGYALHGSVSGDRWTVRGEFLAALDSFEPDEFAFNGRGAEPEAFQAELDYRFQWNGVPVTAIAGVQTTDEALALGLPKTRMLLGLSIEPWQATSVTVELAHDEDYDRADGGTGNSADTVTVQLATGF